MKVPRIVIAGTHSGAGKTTITTGLMAALTRKGYKVQPYKVGPDYIDPSYHTVATGNPSRNLDTWMVGEKTVLETFFRSSQAADITIIEGVMGLYDGASGKEETGSTAQVAKLLKAPVILIVDVKSMARSAAAIVLGFKNLDPDLNLAGVILNRVGSERHYQLVKDAIGHYTDVPIIGKIYKNSELTMPERHLGLVPMAETSKSNGVFNALADIIEASVDMETLLQIANTGGELVEIDKDLAKNSGAFTSNIVPSTLPRVPIAYAWDEAFSFYYQDTLDLMRDLGAELVPFSPLKDERLPEGVGGLYIGGGFPELFLTQLAANTKMLEHIRLANAQGMPIYAECGGLMYLCQDILDFNGQSHQMAGLITASCQMKNRLVAMGYIEAEALQDNLVCPKGDVIKGHEFHYSDLINLNDEDFPWAFTFRKKTTGLEKLAGFQRDNLLASYLHVNMAGRPELAERLLEQCRKYLSLKRA